MKKISFIFFLILFNFISKAQITFNRSDYGAPGDKVLYAVDSPITNSIFVSWAGANQNWKFSFKQTPKRYDSALFLSATFDPNAPALTANLLLRTVANGNVYEEITSNYLKQIQDLPAYNVYGIKLKMLNFPLTFLSTCSDSTTATAKGTFSDFGIKPISGFDSIRIEANIYSNSVCDGWGKLTLPDSTVHNSLSVKNVITINANIFVHIQFPSLWSPSPLTNKIETSTSYQWYEQNSKSYIANAAFDTLGNITSFTHKVAYVPAKIFSPKLISVSPDSMMQGQTSNVTITTQGTHFTQVSASSIQIYNSNFTLNSFQVINDTTINSVFSSKISTATGWCYIEIYVPVDGWIFLSNAFKITASPFAPKLISITPRFASFGKLFDATIMGSYTHFTKGSQVSIFTTGSSNGNIYINSFAVLNDSIINCKIYIDSNTKDTGCVVQVYNTVDNNLYLYNAFSTVATGENEVRTNIRDISFFPNPANNEIHISFDENNGKINVEMIDMTGRIIKVFSFDCNEFSIDVSSISNGIYFLTFSGKDFITTKKIVISK